MIESGCHSVDEKEAVSCLKSDLTGFAEKTTLKKEVVTAPSQPPPSSMKGLTLIVFVALCLTWPAHLYDTYRPPPKPIVKQYISPLQFPKKLFPSYWTEPFGTSSEPRPKIVDVKTGQPFPDNLDRPYPLPDNPPESEAVFPEATTSKPAGYASQIQAQILDNIQNTSLTPCQRCVRSVALGQQLAKADPKSVPGVLSDLCVQYEFVSTRSGLNQSEVCKRTYSPQTLGSVYSQVLSYADLKDGDDSSDALHICNYVVGAKSECSLPAPVDLNANGFLDDWFGGKARREETKMKEAAIKNKRAGILNKRDAQGHWKMLRVLHVSKTQRQPCGKEE